MATSKNPTHKLVLVVAAMVVTATLLTLAGYAKYRAEENWSNRVVQCIQAGNTIDACKQLP